MAGTTLAGCASGGSPAVEAAAPVSTATTTARVTPAPAPARAAPATIRIPAIGVAAPVGALGVNADASVQVPSKPAHTGWYKFGAAPGEDGSAVILGHVDSKTGPAVFARLKELRRGDKVAVTMSDRTVVRYTVTKIATYPNAKFPARRVYAGTGPSTLNLVTCGGAYDPAEGYQSNVVVFTSLAGAVRAGRKTL